MERHASVLAGVWFAGTRVIVRVRASQSDGRLGAWESQEPLHTALPMHVHTREDGQVMLLEGTVSFFVGDLIYHLIAGDTLALPRGVPHAHIITSQNARVLTIAMPGGFEQLFVDLGVPALPDTAPPPLDRGALEQTVARLGVQIVGPPPTLDERG
jgi:mannose-6-phosphate isomerase-like protein (cupin superfamily)